MSAADAVAAAIFVRLGACWRYSLSAHLVPHDGAGSARYGCSLLEHQQRAASSSTQRSRTPALRLSHPGSLRRRPQASHAPLTAPSSPAHTSKATRRARRSAGLVVMADAQQSRL